MGMKTSKMAGAKFNLIPAWQHATGKHFQIEPIVEVQQCHRSSMFQDVVLGSTDISSCWKKEKSTTEASAQTSEILTYEAEIQTAELKSIHVQTEEEPPKPFKLVVDNSQELEDFLKRVEGTVCDQLKKNTESHAFDGYQVQWEEESTSVSCLHTLSERSLQYEYHCTGLSWNCTGSVVGVAFGRFDHHDWCSHKSMLCTWNLDRRSLDCNKADVSIDVPSCLMCVAFHPTQPALIAGGTFSGEVRLWNTGIETDPLLASSGFSDLGHKEPISKVTWITDQDESHSHFLLLSVGTDGKVLIWDYLDARKELKLLRGFSFLTESIPRSLRISKAKADTAIGGTCLSFSMEDKNLFVVGAENGSIFKCSMQSPAAHDIDQIAGEQDFKSPIKFVFRPHHGPVYGICCSPFHRNLFLSCSTDTSARLYSLLDSSPILSVEPECGYLFSISWSTSRPLVFAVGTATGHILIYDLKHSHIQHRVSLDASPHKRAIYSLEYNSKRPQLLASGDASGVVKIWRLSTELTAQTPNEVEQLNAIALETLSTATL